MHIVHLHALLLCVQANAAARKAGTPELFQSGRPRPQSPKNESVEVIINFLTDPRKSDQVRELQGSGGWGGMRARLLARA